MVAVIAAALFGAGRPASGSLTLESPARRPLRGTQDLDEAAKATLKKLSERMASAKTLSASFTQIRRTALTDEPITSKGRLYYRRSPEALVFVVEEPKRTEIHFDGTSYRVYRPADKQLEQFEFEDGEMARGMFMAFNPKMDALGKTMEVTRGEGKAGQVDVVMTPKDGKLKKYFSRLTLSVAEKDGALAAFSFVDADGDDVRFEVTEMAVDPALEASTFELKVPEGVKILKHKVKN